MKNIDEELNEVQKNFSKGDYQLALRKINKLIKNNKRNYIVYNYKGIILVALKSSSEAIENFKKALHLNPDFIEAIGNIGMAYHEMSYFEKAIENYKKAYELSGLVQFEINLGNIYLETRKNKETSATEVYNLMYQYRNDCLIAGIQYNKDYYTDRDLKPNEDLLLTITLFPLTQYEQQVDQNLYRD